MGARNRTVILTVFALILGTAMIGCYGDRVEFNKGEVYYKDGGTKEDAEKLGQYLVELKFFDGVEKSVQLIKRDGRDVVRFVIQDEYLDQPETETSFQAIAFLLSEDVFDGDPVDVDLTDDTFETKKTIVYSDALETGTKMSDPTVEEMPEDSTAAGDEESTADQPGDGM